MNNREKFVVEVPMIVGTDGNQMSKSSGNCIWLDDGAEEMFGKLMSAQDEQILQYIELLSDISTEELEGIKKDIESGSNPRDAKLIMAKAVTAVWHGDEAAITAHNNWLEQFSEGNVPTNIEEHAIDKTDWQIDDLLVTVGLAESKTDARRLVGQGAVKIDGTKLSHDTKEASIADGQVLQVGKRRFVRFKLLSS
jgi:tyrosyl-tRNA synthetase